MNKKTILGGLLAAIAAVCICFIPFKQQHTLSFEVSYFITVPQISTARNWEKWQPELAEALKKNPSQLKITQRGKDYIISAPDAQIRLRNLYGSSYEVDKVIKGKSSSYSFVALPDVNNGKAIITVEQRTSLARGLFGSFDDTPAGTDLLHLKNYLEDPRLYYGFDIRKGMVIDSNIVLEKKVVAAHNKAAEIDRVQQELKSYIAQNQLTIVQPVVADIRPQGNDSVRLMIGFPVNRRAEGNASIRFMHLPRRGHMLTGIYTGRYGDREKLYLAMRNYITDHNLATPEDPYEKYLDNKIPASDTSYVHLQVNFPIY